MKTYHRLAKKDLHIDGEKGEFFKFKAGDKLLTSEITDGGVVTVLSTHWVTLPCEEYFTGEVPAYGHKPFVVTKSP